MSRPCTPLAERFLARVVINDGHDECYGWIGCRTADGYGRIRAGGVDGKSLAAHRVAWELAYGHIPAGLCVLHRCDNPSCTRPDHLFLGDWAANMRDMAAKGRGIQPDSRGSRNGHALLDETKVRAIRADYAAGVKCGVLAKQHGVAYRVIWNAVRRVSWRCVE